ncbi:MAG: response regulator [Gaiellaceae bacterium]
MTRGLTFRTLAASGLLALVVGAVFAALLFAVGDLREATSEARRSDQVLAGAHELERLVLDLETGQRGYVITGAARFLEPWNAARRELPVATARLTGLVRDPVQRDRLAAVDAAVGAYVDEFAGPLITLASRDLVAARARVAGGEGKRRVDAIRRLFEAFDERQEEFAALRSDRADASARRAVLTAGVGLAASVGLVLIFALYVARSVALPLRRIASAADRLATGDYGARVGVERRDEIGVLGRAFDGMAASLEESRHELESQNAELEAQQTEIEAANDELEAQQGELERALAQLGDEKERLQRLYKLADSLAAQTELASLAEAILHGVCDAADAELGTLHAGDGDGEAFALAAARGIDPARLAAEVVPREGLPGRALAERRPVRTSHGESGLAVRAFDGEVAVRHELHLPLIQGGRPLGVLGLARVADRAFSEAEVELAQSLADQAAVALSNVLAFASTRRLARRNRIVLDATVDGIFMLDLEGNIIVRNAPMDALGPPRPGSLYERIDEVVEATTEPERARAFLRRVAADPELEAVEELTLAEPGVTLAVHTAPVRDEEGELLGRIFTLHDVTAEREADRMKSDLIATVSHELRTPLASILGFSELLASREAEPETSRRYLDTIHREARRLTDLVNDFLDLERIEEGALRLDLSPFDLGELLRHEVDLFAGQSREHAISLSLPAEPVEAIGDADRIAQVVSNLVSNAIKYSPAGGPVEVSAAPAYGRLRISVSDRGLGIPSEQQSRIFTKFFRVDTSDTRRIGGTGLGLALAREIAEAHGGRMGFESVEGRGSTFWFELPVAARRARGPSRALVVEPDPACAEFLREALEADGFEVTVAATGEEGLALATADPPAVICLDVGVAGRVDGWEVLARLKASPVTAAVPVVVCATGPDGPAAGALGATDVLVKPFSGDDLRRTLIRVLGTPAASVLVVDDDPAVRALVVETLGGEARELREAANGLEALAAVAERHPDAIVLDLAMPELDGFGVLDRLHADPATRNIPVIVLTARRLAPEERLRLSAQAASLIEKGAYSAQELRRLVRLATGLVPAGEDVD